MAELTNLYDALVDEICDLYSAEKQLVKSVEILQSPTGLKELGWILITRPL